MPTPTPILMHAFLHGRLRPKLSLVSQTADYPLNHFAALGNLPGSGIQWGSGQNSENLGIFKTEFLYMTLHISLPDKQLYGQFLLMFNCFIAVCREVFWKPSGCSCEEQSFPSSHPPGSFLPSQAVCCHLLVYE